jgi:dipicolinate synthase subunit A
MTSGPGGVKVAILGGDAREVFLAGYLAKAGFSVRVVGLFAQEENITSCQDPAEGLRGVQVVILPVPGINERGEVYSAFLERPLLLSKDILAILPAGTPLFVGVARPLLKKMAEQLGLQLIELLNLDEVAILNSIPSAEGAIQIAMEKLPVTIHGSRSFVLGFGRTGVTLARALTALGALTTVAARNPAQRARALEMNCAVCSFQELPGLAGQAEVIFNTVPAFVLDDRLLKKVSKEVLIIDLASSPGGTDFEAARRLGINAILAHGLPGRVAPKTAGKILAHVIPRLIAEKLAL